MRRSLVAIAALALGCAPKIHLAVRDAPDVHLPRDVRTIAIVDRTGAGAGAAETIGGLAQRVEASSRLALAVEPAADAVASLEALAADTRLTITPRVVVETVEGAEPVERTVYDAERAGRIEATWQVVDRDGRW